MRIPNRDRQVVKAQFLPIIIDGVFVIISFNTLIVNGESVMINRRTAQAATNADAFAGARHSCQDNLNAKTIATLGLSSIFAKILNLDEKRSINLGNCQVSLI